jgi:integrase
MRRDVLLGAHGTKQSRVEYARVVAEWEAAGRNLPAEAAEGDMTINEMILRFWPHVEQHYRRPDGTPTSEVEDYKHSLRPVKRLYGDMPAKDFGPLALKAVRQEMVRQPVTRRINVIDPETGQPTVDPKTGKHLKRDKVLRNGLARGLINQRIGHIKRMFRWAVSEELLPESVYGALCTVEGLKRGRTAAREQERVKPVPVAIVEETLARVRPQVAAMARLQLYTGMRPGEVVVMRSIDLDTSGKVWLYRPGSDRGPHGEHKTAWRGYAGAARSARNNGKSQPTGWVPIVSGNGPESVAS